MLQPIAQLTLDFRGGLGHFAVLWAKALGAEVTVLSHSPSKKDDALKMGADHFIETNTDDWYKPLAFKFDFILNTADAVHKFNVRMILSDFCICSAD